MLGWTLNVHPSILCTRLNLLSTAAHFFFCLCSTSWVCCACYSTLKGETVPMLIIESLLCLKGATQTELPSLLAPTFSPSQQYRLSTLACSFIGRPSSSSISIVLSLMLANWLPIVSNSISRLGFRTHSCTVNTMEKHKNMTQGWDDVPGLCLCRGGGACEKRKVAQS